MAKYATAFLALAAAIGARADRPAVESGMAEVAEPALYYEVAGSGEPVVLIHGGQMDRRMWDDQFLPYAKEFRVVRYDVRGYGRSATPAMPYSNVKDLESLLRGLGVARAHLVGLSLGGRIAIDFALEHPERVRSLVLVGPGLSGFQWSHDEEQSFTRILRAAQAGRMEESAELWLQSGYMAPAMQQPRIAARLREYSVDNAKNTLVNPLLERDIEPPAARRLGQIKAPTLVVVGTRDVPDIQRIVGMLEKGIAGARVVRIDGAGHIVNMEKPAEFDRAVLGFLRSQGHDRSGVMSRDPEK